MPEILIVTRFINEYFRNQVIKKRFNECDYSNNVVNNWSVKV